MRRDRIDPMKDYTSIAWGDDSDLSTEEQSIVEAQRKDLWRNGVRTEPLLTRMAYEFGAVDLHAARRRERRDYFDTQTTPQLSTAMML